MSELTTGRWLVRHIIVLAVAIILLSLGLWQLRRLEQRRALNSQVVTGLNQPRLTLTGEDVDPGALHLRRVVVTGRFDNEQGVIIRNRPYQGQPGVHLVVPLRIDGSDRAVLVDRGWIPLQAPDPEAQRTYDLSGMVTVAGIAHQSQTQPEGFLRPVDPTLQPGQARLGAWFRVDVEGIQQQVSYPLLPIYIEQSPDPQARFNEPPVPGESPVLDEGPHLGYAIQWFSFAVILAITYGIFVRQELTGKSG